MNFPLDIVVGKIINFQKHPNISNLNVCTINISKSKSLQVITGLTQDILDKIILSQTFILVVLNKKFQAALRGVKSEGMILDVGENKANLLLLDARNCTISDDIVGKHVCPSNFKVVPNNEIDSETSCEFWDKEKNKFEIKDHHLYYEGQLVVVQDTSIPIWIETTDPNIKINI